MDEPITEDDIRDTLNNEAVFVLVMRYCMKELLDAIAAPNSRYFDELGETLYRLFKMYPQLDEDEQKSVTIEQLRDMIEWCEIENAEAD